MVNEKDVFDFGLEDTIWNEVDDSIKEEPKEEILNESEPIKEPEIIDVEEEQIQPQNELEIEHEKKGKPIFWIFFVILFVLIIAGFIALFLGIRKNVRNKGEEFSVAQIFQDISDKVTDIFDKSLSDDEPNVDVSPEPVVEPDISEELPKEDEKFEDSIKKDEPEEEKDEGEEEIQEEKEEEKEVTTIDYSEAANSTFKNVTLADGSTISGINMVNYINANPDKNCKVYTLFNSEECVYQGGISVSDVNCNANYKVTIVGNDVIFNEE